jgi:hypothetical protein
MPECLLMTERGNGEQMVCVLRAVGVVAAEEDMVVVVVVDTTMVEGADKGMEEVEEGEDAGEEVVEAEDTTVVVQVMVAVGTVSMAVGDAVEATAIPMVIVVAVDEEEGGEAMEGATSAVTGTNMGA